jgi:hypothetical protein
MKKLYIAPQAEIMETMTENIMATHSNDYVDAKQQDMADEPAEKKPLEDLQFRNIWAEEEEE